MFARVDSMTEQVHVTRQYERTDQLVTRAGVWGPGPDGVTPVDVLLTAVVSARPREILEIGCGTGQFAKSVMDAMPECDYLATDQSEAMVAATKRLGVAARQADATQLPFMAETFDGVVAAWVLGRLSRDVLRGAGRRAPLVRRTSAVRGRHLHPHRTVTGFVRRIQSTAPLSIE